MKANGADKTIGEKIKGGQLPGGDVKGKQPTDARQISFTAPVADEFKSLFDGKSMSGWKINETKRVGLSKMVLLSAKASEATCSTLGTRSHLRIFI